MRGHTLSTDQLEQLARQAVHILPGTAAAPVILTCEHASWAVPEPWGNLGLDEASLTDHIGWDIGAGAVTTALAERLGAPAFLAGYSRLFVECNRMPSAPDFIAPLSDGVLVPGNQNVSPAEKSLRKKLAFDPFHQALEQHLEGVTALPRPPVIVSVHSFTPRMAGQPRPWPVGVLWKGDGRFPRAVAQALEGQGITPVGRNQPYDPGAGETMTVDIHAVARKLPHVIFEIRNDLLGDTAAANQWANRIANSLLAALPGLPAAGTGGIQPELWYKPLAAERTDN
ncbi:N-formylglutamate amidohydrolase [Kineobactrum salinum]|uniref:N-formylglutamate amidohydrolase n=1 Tax=Kineobactrum salinum TaxID=2708301 RepID=A0A6C0U322_9GAMM|nr:N-formylglutamate amidohydrolase [Kineobactrum salinum]QIB66338.1 N-formylglutamate amidohydrolase [Kineobactrum salinum]